MILFSNRIVPVYPFLAHMSNSQEWDQKHSVLTGIFSLVARKIIII